MATSWFNGTHITRVVTDPKRALGVRIEAAIADADGNKVGAFEVYSPGQDNWYKDLCEVLAEGYIFLNN